MDRPNGEGRVRTAVLRRRDQRLAFDYVSGWLVRCTQIAFPVHYAWRRNRNRIHDRIPVRADRAPTSARNSSLGNCFVPDGCSDPIAHADGEEDERTGGIDGPYTERMLALGYFLLQPQR